MNATKLALEDLARTIKTDVAHADKYVAELGAWSVAPPVGYEVDGAASRLHHLYGAIEDFVERSIKTFDGHVPVGEDSHMRLLQAGSIEAPGIRGVILPRFDAIDELRRFRHRFRKRYDSSLDANLVHPVVQSTLAAWPAIRAHLVEFVEFVEKCLESAG